MRPNRVSARCWLAFLLAFSACAAPVAAETFLVVPFENVTRASDLDWVGEAYAEALSEKEQMPLSLGFDATPNKATSASPRIASTEITDSIHPETPNTFIRLAKTALAVA